MIELTLRLRSTSPRLASLGWVPCPHPFILRGLFVAFILSFTLGTFPRSSAWEGRVDPYALER